jgi:hypothetical protein
MKDVIRVALTVVIIGGAGTWSAGGETALTGLLPQVTAFDEVHATPSSIPFVALLVFATLVLFLGLSMMARPHAASAPPIRVRDSGLRRAQRQLRTTLLHPRRS